VNEQTEAAWFKTLTIGQIGTIASIIFIAGGVYTKVLAADNKAEQNSKEISQIKEDIGSIKTDAEITKTTVGTLSEDVKTLSEKLDELISEQRSDQQEILRLLRQRND
jgi:uncharacterized protein YoxC